MDKINRRDFLIFSAKMTALMGLASSAVPKVAAGLQELSKGTLPVLWLQGQGCTGCSVSFLNRNDPGPASVITRYISLLFHPNLSATSGQGAMEVVHKCIETGSYILVVEGSIPMGMPEACLISQIPFDELLSRAAMSAKALIALGSCAAFGGIPSAEDNPTDAVGVPRFLTNKKISIPLITLPGCPCHPDWLVGTVVYVHKFGIPELDELNRPKMYYSRPVHEQCPRFADYAMDTFAQTFDQEGCLMKLGCLGSETKADCTMRYWNARTNVCIKSGAPCIGCAAENFAKLKSMPFYTKTGARTG